MARRKTFYLVLTRAGLRLVPQSPACSLYEGLLANVRYFTL